MTPRAENRPPSPSRTSSPRGSTPRQGTQRSATQRSSTQRTLTQRALAQTSTQGLTNSRTRIVGNRTGPAADAVVAGVRIARALRSILARWAARFASVVTPLGWSLLLFVPIGLVFGYALDWVELVVAAYAVVVLILVAIVYLVGRSAFQIELRIKHNRVVVGETAIGAVTVRNPTRRRTLGVTVEVPVGQGLAELVLPGIPRRSESTREFAVPTSRRGVVAVGPARTVRADPIGLVRRELVWTTSTELFVHPRTIGIPSVSTGFVRDLEGTTTRDLTADDLAFHALREYVPGDERRNIHWKSTARTGRYMVRQFEETRRSHVVVALSLASAEYATDAEFEMAVSAAGSLGVRAIRDTRDLSVVVSGTTPEFAKRKVFAISRLSTVTRARLLDDLALVETADSALSILDLARVAGAEVTGVSVAFLVTGSATTAGQLRAASAQFPVGVAVIAVVCDPDAAPDLRRVQELSILRIGVLDDLRSSLDKARRS
ncbi:DUF58 domain-containing protein [soil metagenome]